MHTARVCRSLNVFAALAIAGLGHAQATYNVMVGGRVVGQGKYFIKKLPEGGLENYFSLYFSTAEGKSEFAARGTYNKNGRPIRENYVQKSPAGKKTTLLSYSAGSVKAEVVTDGRRITKTVKVPEGASLSSPSVFWFVKATPRAGSQDRGYEFNSESLRFDDRLVSYIGKETLFAGNRKIVSHKIANGMKTFWLDEKGLPVKIDLGTLQLIRQY
ncbi:MAG: hypothetical protein JNJ45_02480 [Chthonomonas sp.]|nr:hypothetical protein [Chthonomonas sp.]